MKHIETKTISALVVDDDPQIRNFLKLSLPSYGYEIIEAANGSEAVQLASTETPDIILLDLSLPDLEGTDVISNIREWSKVPIIVFSVKSDESDINESLERNADDYVIKPFVISELTEKMSAAIDETHEKIRKVGNIEFDLENQELKVNGAVVQITAKEARLLNLLAKNKGLIVTNKELLREVTEESSSDEIQYLRYYISRIRSKIESDPANPEHLLLEPRIGYRLV